VYYKWERSSPANTLEADAIEDRLQLTWGTIKEIHVGFPPGPAGLVHIQVRDHGWQIVPWTPLQSLAWDNYVFVLPCDYRLDVEPYDLTIRAWNLDDSYPHTVFVAVVLDEQAHLAASMLPLVIPMGVLGLPAT
jgi:hypothetical protein